MLESQLLAMILNPNVSFYLDFCIYTLDNWSYRSNQMITSKFCAWDFKPKCLQECEVGQFKTTAFILIKWNIHAHLKAEAISQL